jgi:TPR repeat protein
MRRRSSSIRVRRPLPMLPPCSALARRGSRLAGCLVLATALLGSVSPTALAAGRHALLIGNSAYSALPPLDNPSLDARLLAKTLGELGFAVSAVTDADYDGMRAAIDAFRREARDAEVALVYYAGHGVQVDGVNYLLPVDAVVQGRDDLRRQGLVLALLLHEIEALAPEFGILVLDACRNNPVAELEAELAQQKGRSLAPREGLAPTISTTGLLVAYATAPGQVALDGPAGGNSPYAEALSHFLREPGLEVGLLFRKVSARVRQATAGAQVPWTEASLTGDPLVLNPAPEEAMPEDAITAFNQALELEDPLQQRWALVRFSRDHEESPLARLALAYVDRLERAPTRPGVQLASLEGTLVDRQRVDLLAGSPAATLAADSFAEVHLPKAPAAAPVLAGLPQAPAPEDVVPPAADGGGADMPDDAATLLWPLVVAADRADYYDRFAALFPNDPLRASAEAGAELASFEPPSVAAAADDPTTRSSEPLLLPVVVGTGPVEVPLPQGDAGIVLREPLRHGRLVARDANGMELPLGDTPVRPAELLYMPPLVLRQGIDEANLALVEMPEPAAEALVAGLAARPAEGDTVVRAAGDAANGPVTAEEIAGEPWTVQFEIKVDACDELAGARFDRQGVVLGRFPNEIDPAAAVPACWAAVERFPEVPRFRFQFGRALEAAGNGAEAAEEYEYAGAHGHHTAIYALGYLHLIGLGVPEDPEKAVALFENAAAKGDPYAMNSLGRAYRDGTGVEADREQAIDWFLKAAAQGHTFAYNNLGYMLAEAGEAERALPLFQASAASGDIYGYNNMGYAYQNGLGVETDIDAAIGWYEKAAEGGQPNAPINLGFLYRNGAPGLEPDPRRAAFWFAEAAKGGNAWGSVHLAALYRDGRLGDGPDPVLAAKILARGARLDTVQGRVAAQQNYGGAGAEARARFADLPARAVVQAVQEELARAGYDPGPVDGLPGQRTERAITEFTAAQQPPLPADIAPIELLAELVTVG